MYDLDIISQGVNLCSEFMRDKFHLIDETTLFDDGDFTLIMIAR